MYMEDSGIQADSPKLISWGHLTLLEEWQDKIMAKGPSGMYFTGEYTATKWKLLCACGKQFEIEKRNFPGRSMMRDCGVECPNRVAARRLPTRMRRARLALTERKHMRSYSMRYHLIERLRLYAVSKGQSDSATLNDLLELALDTVEMSERRKPPIKGEHKRRDGDGRDGKVDGAVHG